MKSIAPGGRSAQIRHVVLVSRAMISLQNLYACSMCLRCCRMVSPDNKESNSSMVVYRRRELLMFPHWYPDSKVHGANMGPTWVLSAPRGPHVGPIKPCYQGSTGTSFVLNVPREGFTLLTFSMLVTLTLVEHCNQVCSNMTSLTIGCSGVCLVYSCTNMQNNMIRCSLTAAG